MPQYAGHPEGVCRSTQDITRERRRQRGAAAVAYGVVVYPPQRVLSSRSRTSGRGVNAPATRLPPCLPCQAGSGQLWVA
jgi:hypothetical protein